MNDTKLEKLDEYTVRLSVGDPRTVRAAIIKVADEYAVTVSMKEAGSTRLLVERTVDSYAAAETVAKACATRNNFPWYKVEVVWK
jgi:hypothetical protein